MHEEAADLSRFRFCIDRPAPAFAVDGGAEFAGWCFDEATTSPVQLRLNIAERSYACETGVSRPDVAAAFPGSPQSQPSGFFFRGWLPAGYHTAHLEVCDAGVWRKLVSFPFCGETAPLVAVIDFADEVIAGDPTITVSGWALHPQEQIQDLWLTAGSATRPCRYGHARRDVAESFSTIEHANSCGFYATIQRPRRDARVLLKAQLASGAIAFAHLDTTVLAKTKKQSDVVDPNRYRLKRLQFHEVAQPKVSIIIPVYNQLEVTIACLESILSQTSDVSYEVILIDDHSSPDTASLLDVVRGIKLIRHPQNLGFIASCNDGAAAACGEYLVFLNNDCEVTQNWLSALLRVFELHEDTGLVGAKLVYPDGVLQEAGGIIWRDASGANYGKYDDPNKPQYNYVREVDYCSGACIAIKKALFDRLGGFDMRFAPAYYEDTDLAFAVRDSGLKVYYQPHARIIHHEGRTSGTDLAAGVKSFQIVNEKKFRRKWQAVLASHGINDQRSVDITKDRGVTKRVLIADARTLTPDQDSGSLRMLNLIKVFQHLGWKVTFLPINRLRLTGYTEELEEFGVECLYDPFVINFDHFLSTRGAEFDLIVLSRLQVAAYLLEKCRRCVPKTPVVFDTVDLHHLRETREAERGEQPETRAKAIATARTELKAAQEADAVIVVSPVEKELLKKYIPADRIAIVSNIHNVEVESTCFDRRNGIVFVGGFEHTPNVDAMQWFCAEILPLVLMQLPGTKLHIVGSKMPQVIVDLASDSVMVHGYVKDLRRLYEQVMCCVAPLRWGAGVKGKINQSMSYGVPVVTTNIGAEGMHLTPGEDVLLADHPAAFAEQVVRLHRDAAVWTQLSKNGIKNIETHFSISAAKSALQRLLVQLSVPLGQPVEDKPAKASVRTDV